MPADRQEGAVSIDHETTAEAVGEINVRTVLAVDDEGELAAALRLLEEVLLRLQPHDTDDEPAAPQLGQAELEALQRISLVVHRINWENACDLYGAGGFNFGKVSAVQLAGEDLAAAGRAIAALSASLLPGGDVYAQEVLEEFCSGAAPISHWRGREQSAAELVAELVQAIGLLALAPDADVELIAGVAEQPGRVDLDPAQEAAYRRYLERMLAVKLSDALERFLYLG